MFERFYGTAWHHPGFAFVAAILFGIALASRRRFLVGWAIVFTIEILADALATGMLSPVPPGSTCAPPSSTTARSQPSSGRPFVILGDFRYFLLLEHCIASKPEDALTGRGLGPVRAWVPAVIVAFVVPLTSTAIREIFPGTFKDDNRNTFLLYESLFLALAVVYRVVVVPRRAPAALRGYLLRLTEFELVQYALWVTADLLIIFARTDVAFLLRLAPNVMYYALFLPFAWRMAPASAREA